MNLVRLKIMFFDFEISESFCYSLRLLNHLKNLKLLNYQTNKKSEISLFKAIRSLKELKNLAIQNPKFCKTPCNIFLKSKNIKVLCLENIFSNEKTQLLASLFSFTFITKFFLTNIFITHALLVKISQMKHLIQLSLKFCAIESIMFPKPLDFSARNIKFLNIYDTNWNNLQYFDILGKLDNIEFLDISLCGLSASYLKNLSPGCNLKLKSVSCESGILDIDDLNIFGKLEIIEELNLSNRVFHNSVFFKLGENCKFFNSLKKLDLMFVDISIEDLNSIRKFKNLKNLSLTLSGLDLLYVKSYIVSLHLNQFITNIITYDENFKSLLENLNEMNINNVQLAKLYNEIEKRKLYSKLYNARKRKLVSVSESSRYVPFYIQDRNVFWGADYMCQHCNKSGTTVDHSATRCEKMLGHEYTRRHNEEVRCLHLLLLNRYKFKSSKRIRSHSVREILNNEIKTDVKIRNNRPDIFILDQKKNKITLIEVGITSQDSLQIVETEKLRKYDLLANDLKIPMNLGAYIRSIVLKKTVETIFFDRQKGLEEEDGVKIENKKNNILHISEKGTTLEEPTINIIEESDLEEESTVVKEVEENA
ncbi:hypothetical protein CWI38_1167p0010 [Hamiltosporidium tvaerminnensis]|uniref:Uncharacterized protein n=1 Tax=Hamiltosporidium tvaerminnensis TaxID=1176355 RepID=A0A4Q9LV92_9MICR|nr:hypothetical protein CWI38_1167p0010 [Hamiltosporidium tvaerminnensis]